MGMVRRGFGVRAGLVCLAVLLLWVGAGARAQEEQEPDAGFGGGQMVRGTVTTAAGDRLAIKTDRGEAFQVTVTTNTRMMKDRQPVRVADVKVGDTVGAMGVMDAPTKTVHAVFVMVVDAEQARKAREGLGKIYITGKVTAIDELKLTILRPDGVSQVIAVDEGTSFRKGGRQMQAFLNGSGAVPINAQTAGGAGRGVTAGTAEGESITLSDIKVGDGVAGKGELKGGLFVPTELSVMDPQRQRRRRPEGTPGAAASPAPGVSPEMRK